MTSLPAADAAQPAHATASVITMPTARPVLLADSTLCAVNGVAYLAIPGLLSEWFGAPSALLVTLGVILLAVAAGVLVIATRTPIPRRGVTTLAAINLAWVLASVAYAVLANLTTLGVSWTLVQAVVVAAIAVLQLRLIRR